MWREPRRGVLVALFPIAYYLLIGSGRTVFARYILPVVPFLCLSAGYAVSCAAAWMTRSMGRPSWRVATTWVMALAVVWPSLRSVVAFDRLLAQEDSASRPVAGLKRASRLAPPSHRSARRPAMSMW